MSAAVLQRSQQHMPRPASSRNPSPMDSKRNNIVVKTEADKPTKDSPKPSNADIDGKIASRPAPSVVPQQPPPSTAAPANVVVVVSAAAAAAPAITTTATTAAAAARDANDVKPTVEVGRPLAPPPRPAPQQTPDDGPDYFSGNHSTQYSREPNIFESSFGQPALETPGGTLLPSIGSLTSPAPPLTGNASLGGGFNWGTGSLRSGPLSPAMLSGPTGTGDYFDSLRGSFPTPNESSLRTGLTPGGGGSMFPVTSPSSQALFNSIAGVATPSTLDFHRTAINASKKVDPFPNPLAPQPQQEGQGQAVPPAAAAAMNGGPLQQHQQHRQQHQQHQQQQHQQQQHHPQHHQQAPHQHFGQHDNDAANGLFLLAQAGNESQANGGQFAVPAQPAHAVQDQSVQAKRGARPNAGSVASLPASVRGRSEMSQEASDGAAESKPNARAKPKKAANGKVAAAAAAARGRKADETPAKQPAAKKGKANNGSAIPGVRFDNDDMVDSEEEQMMKEDQYHENGKKMTDEEKRKNFLERNRVAALKCRQRKKQWLANLQAKVEIFSSENDALTAQVNQLREEILNLKTILIAHKDCPIAQQQANVGQYIPHTQPDYGAHGNPYNFQPGQQVMAGPRRYS